MESKTNSWHKDFVLAGVGVLLGIGAGLLGLTFPMHGAGDMVVGLGLPCAYFCWAHTFTDTLGLIARFVSQPIIGALETVAVYSAFFAA